LRIEAELAHGINRRVYARSIKLEIGVELFPAEEDALVVDEYYGRAGGAGSGCVQLVWSPHDNPTRV
jgi:hypothetical protein